MAGAPAARTGAAQPGHRLRRAGDGPWQHPARRAGLRPAATWPWSPMSPTTTSATLAIETLADLARVKAVVPRAVVPDGASVLNADDPYTVAMAEVAGGEILFFSMDEDNPVVHDHVQQGGRAVVLRPDRGRGDADAAGGWGGDGDPPGEPRSRPRWRGASGSISPTPWPPPPPPSPRRCRWRRSGRRCAPLPTASPRPPAASTSSRSTAARWSRTIATTCTGWRRWPISSTAWRPRTPSPPST